MPHNGEIIFNPFSICCTLKQEIIGNYWMVTENIENLIIENIKINFSKVMTEFIKLIFKKSIKFHLEDSDLNIATKNYDDENQKKKLYLLMINFGFLTYYNDEISIPNEEINKELKEIYYKKVLNAKNVTKNFVDNCKGLELFKDLKGDPYFVDKSNIINELNKQIIEKNLKYVWISKPEGFGKTSIATMLITYYSKGI